MKEKNERKQQKAEERHKSHKETEQVRHDDKSKVLKPTWNRGFATQVHKLCNFVCAIYLTSGRQHEVVTSFILGEVIVRTVHRCLGGIFKLLRTFSCTTAQGSTNKGRIEGQPSCTALHDAWAFLLINLSDLQGDRSDV